MSTPIADLLGSIGKYMEINVNMMITHRKMASLLVILGVMNLVQNIMIALMCLKILSEVG